MNEVEQMLTLKKFNRVLYMNTQAHTGLLKEIVVTSPKWYFFFSVS